MKTPTPDKQRKLLIIGIVVLIVIALALWGVFFLTSRDVTEMKKHEPKIALDLNLPSPAQTETFKPNVVVPGGLNPGEVSKEPYPSVKQGGPVPYSPENQLFYAPPKDVYAAEVSQWAISALSTSPEMMKLGQNRVWEEWEKHLATNATTVIKPEFHEKMMENVKHYSHIKDNKWWQQNGNMKIVYKPITVDQASASSLIDYWGEETFQAVFADNLLVLLDVYTVYTEVTFTKPDGSSETLGAEFGVAVGLPSYPSNDWQIEGIWQIQ